MGKVVSITMVEGANGSYTVEGLDLSDYSVQLCSVEGGVDLL